MGEKWRQVVGFPEYAVSSSGRVRALDRMVLGRMRTDGERCKYFKKGAILKHRVSKAGYRYVMLPDRVPHTVHSLVLAAFIGPRPSSGHHARHLDGDSGNNHIDNLAWGTPKENNGDDRRRHGTIPCGESHPLSLLTEAGVRNILSRDRYHGALADWGREFGVSRDTIKDVIHGRSWKHIARVDDVRRALG